MDVGIALNPGMPTASSRPDPTLGTLRYSAPERVDPNWRHSTDLASLVPSDIFSLGCVFYELLVGDFAFASSDLAKANPPIRPSDIDSSIPQIVSDLAMQMLDSVVANRPRTAADVVQRINGIMPSLTSLRTTLNPAWPTASPTANPLLCNIGIERENLRSSHAQSSSTNCKLRQFGQSALTIGLARRIDFATHSLEAIASTIQRLLFLEVECRAALTRVAVASGSAASRLASYAAGQVESTVQDISNALLGVVERCLGYSPGLQRLDTALKQVQATIADFPLAAVKPTVTNAGQRIKEVIDAVSDTLPNLLESQDEFIHLRAIAVDRLTTDLETTQRS